MMEKKSEHLLSLIVKRKSKGEKVKILINEMLSFYKEFIGVYVYSPLIKQLEVQQQKLNKKNVKKKLTIRTKNRKRMQGN